MTSFWIPAVINRVAVCWASRWTFCLQKWEEWKIDTCSIDILHSLVLIYVPSRERYEFLSSTTNSGHPFMKTYTTQGRYIVSEIVFWISLNYVDCIAIFSKHNSLACFIFITILARMLKTVYKFFTGCIDRNSLCP